MKSLIPATSLKSIFLSEKQSNGAPITIKSKVSGKDYTFKLANKLFNEHRYLHVRVETGYLDFTHIGYYRNGAIIKKGKEITTPSAVAISWVLRNLERDRMDILDSQIEVMHAGKCIKCGKTLTDAESIEIGLGPICRHS
jgi:hypothetical protein